MGRMMNLKDAGQSLPINQTPGGTTTPDSCASSVKDGSSEWPAPRSPSIKSNPISVTAECSTTPVTQTNAEPSVLYSSPLTGTASL